MLLLTALITLITCLNVIWIITSLLTQLIMHSFCRFSQGSNMCTCTQYKVQKNYACYSGNTVNELTIRRWRNITICNINQEIVNLDSHSVFSKAIKCNMKAEEFCKQFVFRVTSSLKIRKGTYGKNKYICNFFLALIGSMTMRNIRHAILLI